LGKIHDALEKSQKQRETIVPTTKGSVVNFYDKTGTSIEHEDAFNTMTMDATIDKNLVALLKPRSIESEMFKILRGSILFPANGKPPRSILVTSALPGEGKSFVSANLAISIAQNINEHVFLMDCDIRKPSVHRSLGLGDVPGLTEYLADDMPLESLLVRTQVKKLTILPGGKPPHNPAELLSSQKMSALLKEVRERYGDRYVIIDSPPPQLTAETSAIARQVDGIIIVLKYGSTPRKMVGELVETLGKEKIIGCVMNWFDLSSSAYYGYGKHGKYYNTP